MTKRFLINRHYLLGVEIVTREFGLGLHGLSGGQWCGLNLLGHDWIDWIYVTNYFGRWKHSNSWNTISQSTLTRQPSESNLERLKCSCNWWLIDKNQQQLIAVI